MSPEERLSALGLALPPAWEPGASLVMARSHGDLLYLAGHMGVDMTRTVNFHGRPDHHPIVDGILGLDIDLTQAMDVARGGALNLIATMKRELGELARVRSVLRMTAMVNTVPGYPSIHKVADAASDLLISVFGDAGHHVRSTVGTTSQPANSCFAIDALCVVD